MKVFLIGNEIHHQLLRSGLMTPHPEHFVFICVSLLHQSVQKQASPWRYLLLTSPASFYLQNKMTFRQNYNEVFSSVSGVGSCININVGLWVQKWSEMLICPSEVPGSIVLTWKHLEGSLVGNEIHTLEIKYFVAQSWLNYWH